MHLPDRITIDPYLCHGKPCARGLCYPVDTLAVLTFAARMTHIQRMDRLVV